jgi:hypothetical protein
LADDWEAVSHAWSFEGDWLSDVGGGRVVPRSRLSGQSVVVTLPLYDAVDGAALEDVRVVARRVLDYERDGEALPRTADGRTRIVPEEAWLEVPADDDGNLTTGAGPRFVVDAAAVRVVTDRLGVFRVFADLP